VVDLRLDSEELNSYLILLGQRTAAYTSERRKIYYKGMKHTINDYGLSGK
jgi:hypothetical protein